MFSSSVASGCTWTWTKALWARLQQCCGLMGYLQKALGEKLPCVWGRCPEAMITITLSVNVGKRWDDAFFRASLTFMWRLWTCFVLCFFSRLFLTQNCRYSVYLFLLTVFKLSPFKKWRFLCDSVREAKCVSCCLGCNELFLHRFLLLPHVDVSELCFQNQEKLEAAYI